LLDYVQRHGLSPQTQLYMQRCLIQCGSRLWTHDGPGRAFILDTAPESSTGWPYRYALTLLRYHYNDDLLALALENRPDSASDSLVYCELALYGLRKTKNMTVLSHIIHCLNEQDCGFAMPHVLNAFSRVFESLLATDRFSHSAALLTCFDDVDALLSRFGSVRDLVYLLHFSRSVRPQSVQKSVTSRRMASRLASSIMSLSTLLLLRTADGLWPLLFQELSLWHQVSEQAWRLSLCWLCKAAIAINKLPVSAQSAAFFDAVQNGHLPDAVLNDTLQALKRRMEEEDARRPA
jgi:hypothetical protein